MFVEVNMKLTFALMKVVVLSWGQPFLSPFLASS